MKRAYPKPDRSDFTPNFQKTAENDVIDIGWTEGEMSDGRPCPVEMWAQDQMTLLTFFFSTQGLDGLSEEAAASLLEREELIRFTSAHRSVGLRQLSDAGGNSIWSVTVVVGDEDSTFVESGLTLKRYAKDAGTVEFDEVQISCRRPSGLVESVPWSELRAVLIEANSAGPFVTDVFWVLVGEKGGCVVPMGTEGEDELLKRLQGLPKFDNEMVIEAMACTEDRKFLCWRREEGA